MPPQPRIEMRAAPALFALHAHIVPTVSDCHSNTTNSARDDRKAWKSFPRSTLKAGMPLPSSVRDDACVPHA